MADKRTLRRLAKLLSPSAPEEGHRVVHRLVELLGDASTGCVYLPMPGELDVTSLVEHRGDVDWFTTRTVDRTTLTVHRVDSEYEAHPFGYQQPISGSPEIDAAEIDVWIVPGVAFDERGHRLGHGMGYYDRLLARARPEALLIGVTTERRVFPGIPHDRFDIPMDLIVTEERVIRP
jgi:5-formyltetrahydrofolate cyclo-ligase